MHKRRERVAFISLHPLSNLPPNQYLNTRAHINAAVRTRNGGRAKKLGTRAVPPVAVGWPCYVPGRVALLHCVTAQPTASPSVEQCGPARGRPAFPPAARSGEQGTRPQILARQRP